MTRWSPARATYATRAGALCDALRAYVPEARFVEPEGGFSIWVELDDPCPTPEREHALLAAAVDAGTSFDPGSMFRVGGATSPLALRLSFSHCAAEDLEEGARRLAAALTTFRRTGAPPPRTTRRSSAAG
jgi:2-aminoadipate transaminase